MIYFVTTLFLDVTYGVIDWTARKIFSYVYKNTYTQPVLKLTDILEKQQKLLDKQTHIVQNYRQIIEKQQEEIDVLLNYNK